MENYKVSGQPQNISDPQSPFNGTPWKSDQEIYDYASNLKYNLGWGWPYIKEELVRKGLNPQYAEAIVNNLIAVAPSQNGTYNDASGLEYIDNRGMFRRPFSFKGRIRRTEYCLSLLMYYIIVYGAGFLLDFFARTTLSDTIVVLYFVIIIPALWFFWAQNTKRCHDLGHSGWFQLIPFYIFWMMFASGDAETTGYGTNPKAV